MAGQWNIQWLNANSQRSYPLTDEATKTDTTGTLALPDDFLVSLHLPVHAGQNVAPEKFYVQSIGIYASGYVVKLGYDDGLTYPVAATASIDAAGHTENAVYSLAGLGNFADSDGHLVVNSLAGIATRPPGIYSFDPLATGIEADCVRPILRGVSSLTVVNGSDRSPAIYGHVEFVAGRNCRLQVSQNGDVTEITISAISGEGLNEACVCEDNTDGPPIRFINGIPPNGDGNYRVVGDDCLEVRPMTNGLQLKDNCSAPCCGSAELERIVSQIDAFADGVATLNGFVTDLSSQVTQMGLIVLGSRLGDRGCF